MAADHAEADFQAAMALLAANFQSPDWNRVSALIDGAAAAGHAEATERRALLECRGVFRNADWDVALNSLAMAADRGSQFAARQLLLLADDRLEPDNSSKLDAADWSDVRSRVDIARLSSAPATRGDMLSASPIVHAIPGFASAAECRWLIDAAAPRLDRAVVYNNPSGVDPGRTNRSTRFSFANADLVVEMIRQRIASRLGAPLGCLEMSQALHYSVGQEFVLHCDFLDPQQMREEIARNGQRVATVLIYLNEDFEGGETSFPRLGINHRGRTGDALVFGSLDSAGRPDPQSQHAGCPPTQGEKWVFSQWVRNRPPG
ncbi:2OG-Fe(II) oxygenase [Sphingomonas sp.]|uniref:2OG-Fe(II) oxygenase n=1 Tax=Sphingomonas sp. TaxID=28214 RepID=UPI0025FA12D2|nr:2OG-Fe(II) oxygenase [Sphingomonas sp.]